MNIREFDGELKLQNDGKLSLFFLGIGSAFSKLHYQNNLLVIKGDDALLIDCGTVCPTAFYNYKSNIMKVRNFLVTHSHADHCGGNSYFVEHYNCQLWATKGEAALMEFPELETSLIWGGTPINEMRSKFLLAKPWILW